MKRFENISEHNGPSDNPIIVMARKLCGIIGKSSVDEIPWCSSSMNLCMVLANIERNPLGAMDKLRLKGFDRDFVISLYALIGLKMENSQHTGVAWVEPTFSAAAASWDAWGLSVPVDKLEVGDLVRLTRENGGHIAFFEGQGNISFKLFGGNQDNKFCSSEKYMKTRFVTARRWRE